MLFLPTCQQQSSFLYDQGRQRILPSCIHTRDLHNPLVNTTKLQVILDTTLSLFKPVSCKIIKDNIYKQSLQLVRPDYNLFIWEVLVDWHYKWSRIRHERTFYGEVNVKFHFIFSSPNRSFLAAPNLPRTQQWRLSFGRRSVQQLGHGSRPCQL